MKLTCPKSPEMRLMKYPWNVTNQPSSVVGASCVLPHVPVDEMLNTIILEMPTTCLKWDKTVVEVKNLQTLSSQHTIYQYIYDPGRSFFLLSKRDMVYLDSWTQDPTTKRVMYVGGSLPELETLFSPSKNVVRSYLHFHCKRLTPQNDGKGTLYETAQLVDLCGNLPYGMTIDGMLTSLYEEVELVYGKKGFKKVDE